MILIRWDDSYCVCIYIEVNHNHSSTSNKQTLQFIEDIPWNVCVCVCVFKIDSIIHFLQNDTSYPSWPIYKMESHAQYTKWHLTPKHGRMAYGALDTKWHSLTETTLTIIEHIMEFNISPLIRSISSSIFASKCGSYFKELDE